MPDALPDPVPLLREYVRIDTSNPPGNEGAAARYLASLLSKEGIPSEIVDLGSGRANLVARLKGDGSKRALLLFSHMDVVQADRARWSVDPFAGLEKDGFIYGRGALDMKATGLLQVLTLARLKRAGAPLSRDVILLATSDEEVDSLGMTKMIALRPELFREIELALTEGDTIAIESGRVRSWNVDVSEKSALWLRLTATGRAGHASVPYENENAVDSLVRALDRVRRYDPPVRVVPAVQGYFSKLKNAFPGLDPAKLDHLAASLANPAFRTAFFAEPERAALVRNTVAITVLKGGPQTNVIPGTASAELDCRLLPGEDPNAFIGTIRGVIDDPAIAIEIITPVFPPSSSSTNSDLYRAIEQAGARFAPGVPVVPTILTSWTESSLLRPLGIQSYGFEPYALTREDNQLMHGDDERISIENLHRGAEILYEIVMITAGSDRAPAVR